MFYQKKELLDKPATVKRFEYSLLGKELKITDCDIVKNNING